MQINSKIDVITTIKQGKKLYSQTLLSFIFYALIATVVSFIVPLYIAVFDTYFADKDLIYMLGLIVLLFLYFPIVYYSIRFTITNAEKLKSRFKNERYRYKKGFELSKLKFWRVFYVFVVRFILKSMMIISVGLPVYYFVSKYFSNVFEDTFNLTELPLLPMLITCLIVFVISLYFIIRFEFATVVIFWNIDSKTSDLKSSMLLTRKHMVKKIKIMIVAHLPSLFISSISLFYMIFNLEDMQVWARWVYLTSTFLLNVFFYSWTNSLYYALMVEMKCVMDNEETTVDENGREWLSF